MPRSIQIQDVTTSPPKFAFVVLNVQLGDYGYSSETLSKPADS